MNYLIKNLEREQVHEIYNMWIHRHFPENEIKPLKNIDKMWDMGCYCALGMYKAGNEGQGISEESNEGQGISEESNEGQGISEESNEGQDVKEESTAGRVISYAFFAMAPECDMLLLDYFAVVEEYRSQGMGGIFLKEMRKLLTGYRGILIETENVEYAQNKEELEVRSKRDLFYGKNGVLRTQIRSRVYGVDYAIWNLPVQEELSSQKEFPMQEGFPGEESDHVCGQKDRDKIPDSHCKRQLEQIYRIMVPGEKYEKYVNIYEKL